MDNRLALVFLPFLVWPAVYALHRIHKRFGHRFATVITLFAVIHLTFYWSYGSQQRLVKDLSLQYEYNRVLEYLEPRYPKHGSTLIITEQPNLYLVHNYSSMRFSRIHKILEILSAPNLVDNIIALQKIEKKSGKIGKRSVLYGPFKIEPLEVISISPEIEIKISTCTLIKPKQASSPNRPE
jgi:hypothetical protein